MENEPPVPQPEGRVFVQYRIRGVVVVKHMPSEAAHRTAAAAVQQGADHHVLTGTWDAMLRRHVPPMPDGDDLSFDVLEPEPDDLLR